MSLAKGDHHVRDKWRFSEIIQQKFPSVTLWVEWAYTFERINLDGKQLPAAPLAESWLLMSYSDSFGELPPMNHKG
jgi:hypothetical protein